MKQTILFSGGYTLGPVTPLLAMAEALPKDQYDFFWIGTRSGPECQLVKEARIPFASIQAGKLRRYVSLRTFTDAIRFGIGVLQSIRLLKKHKPALCITTGGFVSVPVHVAAKLLKISTIVHQQDIEAGLANTIMARWATVVSAATAASAVAFEAYSPVVLGNPVRVAIQKGSAKKGKDFAGIVSKEKVVLALGGGTGAEKINTFIKEAVPVLKGEAQIIHLSGQKRAHKELAALEAACDWYHHIPFVSEELPDILAAADIVVSRAGFGTLTELSALKKLTLLIPKAGHQQKNAAHIDTFGGAIVLDEEAPQETVTNQLLDVLHWSAPQAKKLTDGLSKAIPIASPAAVRKLVSKAIKK
ncbi:MAG: hypothetical protein HOE53_02910 [Candidatus Magasanikbacteria bacterium]|jgi:UDP-N-acetylglucosamine--N-acetylmuramyl-(pentapeptide) pyrophosphoryl-undecaprenol N-acetylglucosamine transferase|nr:hypothetical protein [Candidatus Magasanikbacteria bacterium]